MAGDLRARQTAPPYWAGYTGLADTLAAALRGATKSGLGLPGDLESLGRAGINYVGGEGTVNPETALPTSEDMGRHLPPLTPLTPNYAGSGDPSKPSTAERLGEFLPGPTALEAMPKALALAKSLRKTQPEARAFADTVPDASRRQFLGQAGGAALAAAAPSLALKTAGAAAPEAAAPLAAALRSPGAAAAATTAAKGAFRAWTPALAAKLMKNNAMVYGLEHDLSHAHFNEDAIKALNKTGVTPEQMAHYDSWAGKKKPYEPPTPETEAAREAANVRFQEELKTHPKYSGDKPEWESLDDALHYGLSPEEHYALRRKHEYRTPEEARGEAARGVIEAAGDDAIKKAMLSGKLPEEWVKKGVKDSDFADYVFPDHPRFMRTSRESLKSDLDKFMFDMDMVMGKAHEAEYDMAGGLE